MPSVSESEKGEAPFSVTVQVTADGKTKSFEAKSTSDWAKIESKIAAAKEQQELAKLEEEKKARQSVEYAENLRRYLEADRSHLPGYYEGYIDAMVDSIRLRKAGNSSYLNVVCLPNGTTTTLRNVVESPSYIHFPEPSHPLGATFRSLFTAFFGSSVDETILKQQERSFNSCKPSREANCHVFEIKKQQQLSGITSMLNSVVSFFVHFVTFCVLEVIGATRSLAWLIVLLFHVCIYCQFIYTFFFGESSCLLSYLETTKSALVFVWAYFYPAYSPTMEYCENLGQHNAYSLEILQN